MSYVISDETRSWIEGKLGGRVADNPPSVPPFSRQMPERAVYAWTGNLFAGYHYAELKWRDEPNFTWASFDPPVYCWALTMNEEELTVGDHYPGFFVNVETWSGLNLAVFAVGGGGGTGEQASIIRVTNPIPDANGYFDGVRQTFNTSNRTWTTVETVKIRDANQDP